MNNSNLSANSGFSSFRLDNGDTSTGYSVTKVGSIKFDSTVSSNASRSILPGPQLFSIFIFLFFKNSSSFFGSFKLSIERSLLCSNTKLVKVACLKLSKFISISSHLIIDSQLIAFAALRIMSRVRSI